MVAGAGHHNIAFEYRSADPDNTAPINSYAQLSWSGLNMTVVAAGAVVPLFADVGWFAVSTGTGSIDGEMLEAGYASAGASSLVVDVAFTGSFGGSGDIAPHIFAGYQATSTAAGGHCRLLAASRTGAAIALEYDSCYVAATGGARNVGWLALASATSNEDTRVHQQPTFPSDVVALLAMASDLRLPGYLRWRTGSDPCRDRWAGLECRADGGQAPRVVMVDIHNIDLAGHGAFPFSATHTCADGLLSNMVLGLPCRLALERDRSSDSIAGAIAMGTVTLLGSADDQFTAT